MNKHTLLQVFLPASLLIWGQLAAQSVGDIDLSDVVVIEDAAPTEAETSAEPAAVVEIPEVEIEGASIDVEAPVIPEVTEALPGDTEIVLEIPGQEAGAPGEATMESEETISVDFPDEDVRTILRNVADLFDLNLVIPDTLQGRTSVKLRNITWRQVFEVVLEPFGYTYVEDRNIIRVKSIEELTTEPVDTRIFVVGFADALEIQGSISPLIDAAAGGQVQVDKRSNALVITERPSRMNKIQEIIEALDKPTAQVMIESKFIEVINNDQEDLGVNWAFLGADEGGFGLSAGPLQRNWDRSRGGSTTTTTGSIDNSGFSSGEGVTFEDSTSLAQDVVNAASTSRLDTAVFSATDIGVVLTALSQNNQSKLMSNPTVITMNNEEASIDIVTEEERVEFEFNEETGTSRATGVGEPLVYGTKIKVRPQVSAAGFINLAITPEVSSKVGERPSDFGTLTDISKRTATTNVMIKDGYTLALGGLSQNEETLGGNKVPILGDIPGLGRLFKSKSDTTVQRNLVIFITAKTLNPDGSSYRDIVDPRVLNKMGITPAEVPGYNMPEEDLKLILQLEQYRMDAETSELIDDVKARIKQIDYAKQQAEEERISEERK